MKKLLLSFLLALGFVSTTQPISLQAVYGVTGGVGVLSTAGTYWFTSKHDFSYPAVWSIGVGGLASAATYFLLYQYTPEGRYAWAQVRVQQAGCNPLSSQPFESDAAFFDVVEDLYIGEDWWLVTAFNELTILLDGCRLALDQLDQAKAGSGDNFSFVQQCNTLSGVARKYILNMTNAVKRIRNHKDYIAQMKEFKRMEMEKQKLAVEQAKANAAMSQANASWSQAGAHWRMAGK
jgi:hypothetical protein